MSLGSSNRLRYYYEHILRYDLLLKLNYKNIMQVPQISKVNILVFGVPYNNAKNISLALEIICGQKVVLSDASLPTNFGSYSDIRKDWLHRAKVSKSPRYEAVKRSTKRGAKQALLRPFSGLQSNLALLFCSLRTETMYNFIEKLIAILTASYDYKMKIQKQKIQITLSNRDVRLFPEIENHFEFFESFQYIQVTLVTSASNEKETLLLWTGLLQK